MLKPYLEQVLGGNHLQQEAAGAAMEIIMNGQAGDTQLAAFLAALRLKGETAEEITGFASAMRRHAVSVFCRSDVVDTCGTGGDRKGTFNVSTAVAFVLAGGGIPVAKHGNRGISSACGSADVLAELGVQVDLPPEAVGRAIDTIGIGFLFAPRFHPAMSHVARVRREMGTRTVFNMLGPLTNPAGAKCQVMGVYDRALTVKLAEVLQRLGTKRAMVVHSHDGMDEISTEVPTQITEVNQGKICTYTLDPREYGFQKTPNDLPYQGGTPGENARMLREILEGKKGSGRDIVLINSAAGFVVAGLAEGFSQGLAMAKESMDTGAALGKLEALREFTCCQETGEQTA